ncbi:MAG: hypothetical protein AB7S26_13900 [Sandaracinaceae bacterium]
MAAKVEKKPEPEPDKARQRLTTVFGWLAGGSLGLLINYAILTLAGESYPTTYTTFGFFLVGAFGGMAIADRMGTRGFRPLGIAAGLLLAILATIVLMLYLLPADS